MKALLALSLLTSLTSFSADPGYLKKEDMPYYKNDSFEGQNKMERIDSLVREMNRVIGEMRTMKSEIETLKAEVASLKKK